MITADELRRQQGERATLQAQYKTARDALMEQQSGHEADWLRSHALDEISRLLLNAVRDLRLPKYIRYHVLDRYDVATEIIAVLEKRGYKVEHVKEFQSSSLTISW